MDRERQPFSILLQASSLLTGEKSTLKGKEWMAASLIKWPGEESSEPFN
jgi:hypothetical protein